jgi:hypothetical protein
VRRALAALATLTFAVAALPAGRAAEATGVHCQSSASGTYTGSSSCTKTDHAILVQHRAQVRCRYTSTGWEFNQYGPWKTTLLSGYPNWSTASCPVGSYRIGVWANWRII